MHKDLALLAEQRPPSFDFSVPSMVYESKSDEIFWWWRSFILRDTSRKAF
jgi:hypothetical protein